ncbi:MAG: outer membrane protein assembly factor [Luteolibacter sp.]
MHIPIRIPALICLAAGLALGETRVRIDGLQRKSESQVLQLLGDRLVHVRNKPATPPRADDAAFLLRESLRSDGYSEVEVDWRIVSPSEILLTVREGRRYGLGKVEVRGAADADQARRMSRLMTRQAERNRPLGVPDPPFRESDIPGGLAAIRQELHANGYWAAEVGLVERRDGDRAVDLVIEVDPGPRFTIGPAVHQSADGRGVVRARTTSEPFVGRPATTANLNELRLAMETAFTSRGYPDARMRMGSRLEGSRFIPVFDFDLGLRVRLREVTTQGLERTRENRVLRRFTPLVGQWYDEAAMNQRVNGLLATGAFSSVRIETEEVAHKRIRNTLHFEEARAREVSLAYGIGSYEGAIVRASYADRNLFGALLGFSTGVEVSMLGMLGETRLTDPWMFGRDLSGTLRHYALSYSREGYDSLETGLEGILAWKIGDHYSAELSVGSSIVSIRGDGLPRSDLGETQYLNPRVRFTQHYDRRDNPVIPKSGWHLTLPLEIGAAIGDNDTGYFLAGIAGGWYYRIDHHHQLALGGSANMIVPTGDRTEFPIDLRLFSGGARSIRSFPERELGPVSANGFPTGGEAAWTTHAELTRVLAGSLKATAFIDAGALGRDHTDFASADVEVAAGLGLRFDLPIGPVRLEYGHNLTRDRGEPSGTFHFAIGVAF